MATISGKRFQITDGASTPTNLFPYTVTEAVYGLSTVLANTQSAAVSAAATSAASLYLPLTGGTITGNAFMKGAILEWLNSSNTALGAIRANDSNVFQYYDTTFWRTVYHSGNSNKSDVAWQASSLTLANEGHLYFIDKPASGTGTARSVLYFSDGNSLNIGYGTSALGYNTYLNGNNVYLRYGTSRTPGIALNSSGNVGIGTASPGVMLDVNGPSRSKYHYFYSTYSSASVGYIGCGSGSTDNVFLHLNSGVNLIISSAGGNVGIGNVSSPSQKLHVVGNILSTGDQVISSDINLKENLAPVTYSVEDIAKTRAVTFDWKDGRGKSAGSIAQDWKPLIPELVHGEEGNMTLAYGQIALVNSILLAKHETEQDKEIARLKARVKELETRLNIS